MHSVITKMYIAPLQGKQLTTTQANNTNLSCRSSQN